MVKTSVGDEVPSFVCPAFQISITHILFFSASRVKMNGILFVALAGLKEGYQRFFFFLPSDAVFLSRPLHTR